LLWLIRRPQTMPDHAGQIALPGGGYRAEDQDLGRAALRETQEELGFRAEDIRLLGRLDETWTPSGYRIAPYVGWIQHPTQLAPDPREVDEVIATSLRELTREGVYREDWWTFEGVRHRMVFFDLPAGTVWGATSRILFRFLQIAMGWKPEVEEWEAGPRP